MKIAVIGASGNLGSRVVRQALERGHELTAIQRSETVSDERVRLMRKSLFDLTREDLMDMDVIISTFGSGFKADPSVNRDAFMKYIELADGTDKHLIAIAGTGSLYTDRSHSMYEYETPGHPEFLKGISMNIRLGIDELRKTNHINWTVVCPSRDFDPEGPFTGEYLVGTEGEVIYNEEGNSYVTYDDLAKAMIDIAEQNSYQRMKITVATKKSGLSGT